MGSNYKFEAWLGLDKKAAEGNMQWGPYEPKKWSEDDVDIEISHCGICGSDLHTLRSGWKPTDYPCVVG
jgi:alcohol dehydrogenase (NADP+)